MRFGRWIPKPANALRLVAWVTAMGLPDCIRMIPASCQPPAKTSCQPFKGRARPRPNGSSYTKPLDRIWGTFPVETSFSSRLLKLSAAWKFATGPVSTAESKTAPASSINRENV